MLRSRWGAGGAGRACCAPDGSLGTGRLYQTTPQAPSSDAFLAIWLAYGIYYGVNDAVGKALVADLAPAERRATAFGIINAVVGFALLPASLLAGVLWDAISPSAPFWFGASCAAAATVLLVVAMRPPVDQRLRPASS